MTLPIMRWVLCHSRAATSAPATAPVMLLAAGKKHSRHLHAGVDIMPL